MLKRQRYEEQIVFRDVLENLAGIEGLPVSLKAFFQVRHTRVLETELTEEISDLGSPQFALDIAIDNFLNRYATDAVSQFRCCVNHTWYDFLLMESQWELAAGECSLAGIWHPQLLG